MSRARTGGATVDLAASFTRAWQIRFTAVMLLITCLSVTAASTMVDSLQLSPAQKADSLMGHSDGYIEIPGSATLGSNGADFDAALSRAVTSAGGIAPTVDYLVRLKADGDSATSYLLKETTDPAADARQLRLDSGNWPTKVGETAVSVLAARSWPLGSSISFFNGMLSLRVVGIYTDVFHSQDPQLIVAPGTWSTLDTIPASAAASLNEAAARNIRWTAGGDGNAILASVTEVVREFSAIEDQTVGADAPLLTVRRDVESAAATTNLPLDLARLIAPLITGIISGLLGGVFLRRIRRTLWTVGVPYRQTAFSALLAVISSAAVGAIVGYIAGALLGFAVRPMLAGIATQPLGPISSLPLCAVAIPIGVIGAVIGVGVAGRQRKPLLVAGESEQRELDHHLYRVAAAFVILSLGIFFGAGANGANQVTLSAVLIALAILIAVVPFLVSGLGRIRPRLFANMLAFRKFAAERRANTFIVIAIAALQVIGFSYAVLVTTDVAQLNDQTESYVPPGQISFEPMLDSQSAIDTARQDFEQRLKVSNPVVETVVAVFSELEDGATLAVGSPDDVQRVTGIMLSEEQRAFLEGGGTFLTKPGAGSTLSFHADGEFEGGVTLPARQLPALDPSFRNISGFILVSTATNVGLPLTSQVQFVYTDLTTKQVAGAKAAAVELNMSPSFVQVYTAPDVVEPPLRIIAIMMFLAFIAGVVLLFTAASQTRSLRPDFSGLRAIGIGSKFMATVVGVRMALTFVLATVLAIVVTLIGVNAAFGLARMGVPLRIPLMPSVVMVVSLAVFCAIAAVFVTRRLRNYEWLD